MFVSASRTGTQEILQKTARKGNTHASGPQGARGGGEAPSRNNRMTESATKDNRAAKGKANEAIQDERTKRPKKEQGRGTWRTTEERLLLNTKAVSPGWFRSNSTKSVLCVLWYIACVCQNTRARFCDSHSAANGSFIVHPRQ